LPGGGSSKAFAISDTRLIVGSSGSPAGTRAVLWTQGRIENLGTLPGDTISEALGINNRGDVVGASRGPAGMRAFLWTAKNGMQGIAALPGGNFSRAMGINERGEIVGSSGSALSATTRAVIWNPNGQPQDLNTLVSVPPGLVLLEAVGINASGQIVVLGRDEKDIHGNHEGPSRVFLLTPAGS
jgi:probable HAF family extracellular repeat protein